MICVLKKEVRELLFAELMLAVNRVAQDAGINISDEFGAEMAQHVADAVQPMWETIRSEFHAQEAARVRTGHGGIWPKVQP